MRPLEHPQRLAAFREATQELSWSPAARAASLDTVFRALDDLVQAEIHYYYRERKRRRIVSLLFRSITLLLVTAGVTVPLAAAANPTWKENALWGYVLLAVAGGLLAADRLFGATGGHIRFVVTQYKLEEGLTSARLAWQQQRSKLADSVPDDGAVERAFALLQALASRAYKDISEETSSWAGDLTAAVADLAKRVETKK